MQDETETNGNGAGPVAGPKVEINLSATIELAGAVVPLSTQGLDLGTKSLSSLQTDVKKGVSFGLPSNSSITANLGALFDWIGLASG